MLYIIWDGIKDMCRRPVDQPKPEIKEIVGNDLDQARRDLLDAEAQKEFYEGRVDMLTKRIHRLECHQKVHNFKPIVPTLMSHKS